MKIRIQIIFTCLVIIVFSITSCKKKEAVPSIYTLGQSYGGGYIFYIDDTGLHGLIVAPIDQSVSAPWGNVVMSTNAIGIVAGTGQTNTTAIKTAQGPGYYAAIICDSLVLNGYNDWFLPSRDELNLVYLQIKETTIGGFSAYGYWSSSENGNVSAWFQSLSSGSILSSNKNFKYYVRAVRAF
jgi:hypothetical protein